MSSTDAPQLPAANRLANRLPTVVNIETSQQLLDAVDLCRTNGGAFGFDDWRIDDARNNLLLRLQASSRLHAPLRTERAVRSSARNYSRRTTLQSPRPGQ